METVYESLELLFLLGAKVFRKEKLLPLHLLQ